MTLPEKKVLTASIGAGVIALASLVVMPFEGLVLSPYLDPVNITSVCYGETKVEMRSYTPKECREMLDKSLDRHGQGIKPCMPDGLPDHVQAASLSFAYNVGTGAFCKSTMSRKLMAGDIPGACAELSRWIYAGGKVYQGLVKRRAAERAMCEGRVTSTGVIA